MDALLSWDPSPEPDVFEYHVYRGYEPDVHFDVQVVFAPTTQYQFVGLDDYKRHYFVVTAFNGLESAKSVEVSKAAVSHAFVLRQG